MKNRLVAHRGDMTQFIENTLPAVNAAVDLGMQSIEIDVQLSSDLVPMVIHDDELIRLTGKHDFVTRLNQEDLQKLWLNVSAKKQATGNIPTLQQVIMLLNQTPEITLFVEIKKESINVHGLQTVMDSVMRVLQLAKCKIVIISFVYDAVMLAKKNYQIRTGWVFTNVVQAHGQAMLVLQPEFVFCDLDKIDQIRDFEDYPWQWVLYDSQDPRQVYQLMQSDNVMIETGDIHKLMGAVELA